MTPVLMLYCLHIGFELDIYPCSGDNFMWAVFENLVSSVTCVCIDG